MDKWDYLEISDALMDVRAEIAEMRADPELHFGDQKYQRLLEKESDLQARLDEGS